MLHVQIIVLMQTAFIVLILNHTSQAYSKASTTHFFLFFNMLIYSIRVWLEQEQGDCLSTFLW